MAELKTAGVDDRAARKTAYPLGASVDLPAFARAPYAVLQELLDHEPVSWIPALDMWYVTRYADVQAILLNDRDFLTGGDGSPVYATFGPQMLSVEGERHERYKALLRPGFMPKSIRAHMEARVVELADGLIDGFMGDGAADLRTAFAARLPVQTVLALFGLPLQEEAHVRRWFDSFGRALENYTGDVVIAADARRSLTEFHDLLDVHIQRVRRITDETPLSQMVHDEQAERLSDDEIKRNISIIFFGGISTVEALILNSLYALLSHPDALRRVRAEIGLVTQALDETIRWISPVQSATRHVREDVIFGDVVFRAGETVNCMLGAANRDPAMFDDPGCFNLDRRNSNRHLGFAAGPHHCLGSHLAKAEARISLQCLLERLPDLGFADDRPSPPMGYEFHQPETLRLKW